MTEQVDLALTRSELRKVAPSLGLAYSNVLVVNHISPQHERYRFICQHGKSEREADTYDAQGITDQIFALVKQHHLDNPPCHCALDDPGTEWWERWYSRVDALAMFEKDMAGVASGEFKVSDTAKTEVAFRFERFRALNCDQCDPSVIAFRLMQPMESIEEETVRLVHHEDCPNFVPPLYEIDGLRAAIAATFR